MSEIVLLILFLMIGGVTGVIAGMVGIGGGIVFVPVLYILLPYTPIDISQVSYLAIGTSLFAASISSLSSGTNHLISSNVDKKKAILFASGSVLAAVISPFFVIGIKPVVLHWIFAAVFVLILSKMLYDISSTKKKKNEKPKFILNEYYLILIGIVVGMVSAFAGIGGGSIYVAILMFVFALDIKNAVGTSSVVVAFTAISGSISYLIQSPNGVIAPFQLGYVYLIAGVPLGIGAAVGAYIGVKIVVKSSSDTIKKVFTLLLLVIVIKIIIGL